MNDDDIRGIADGLAVAFRGSRPRQQTELDAQLAHFQAAFHAIQKERDAPTAIAWCAPAIDVLAENARAYGLTVPDWFADILTIVQLQAASERIKSATEGLKKALEDLARSASEGTSKQ
jgi:hypothetical protein